MTFVQYNFQLAQADIDVERETYQKSREGLNEMYNVIRKQLDSEMQLRKVGRLVDWFQLRKCNFPVLITLLL